LCVGKEDEGKEDGGWFGGTTTMGPRRAQVSAWENAKRYEKDIVGLVAGASTRISVALCDWCSGREGVQGLLRRTIRSKCGVDLESTRRDV